jgi:hypothetical protein
MDMDTISIDHVLKAIGIVVGLTASVIGVTCGLALKWINNMCDSVKDLKSEFSDFVKLYYEKHEDTIKKQDCIARHAILDKKVDKLHDRVDTVEMDRR